MDDDDAQFEARMRLDALYASISRALDLAEARGAQRERERITAICDDVETDAGRRGWSETGYFNDARYYDGRSSAAAEIRDALAVQP